MAESDSVYALYMKTYTTAFPHLIDSMDKNEQTMVGNLPLTESNTTRYESYIGMNLARMIEHMLSNWPDSTTYKMGMIYKEKANANSDKITLADMKEIKQIYEDWWQRSKTKSLSALQKEWRMNKRPLTGTNYSWF
jgi:hypothetical protein